MSKHAWCVAAFVSACGALFAQLLLVLASRIGHDLFVEYTTDPSFEPRAEGVEDNLGNVADAVANPVPEAAAQSLAPLP